jgi:methylated-DNA-protein-cysteine methyltransferase related protein
MGARRVPVGAAELRTTTVTGEPRVVDAGFHAKVHAAVRRVPKGRVTTYGDVAGALGSRRVARHVGWALAALDAATTVPWHRVINGQGRISFRGDFARGSEQEQRLAAEGVVLDDTGRVVDFKSKRWAFNASG